MKSGRKKFDGYDPDRNVLIDAKDWKTGKDGWPVEGQDWPKDKTRGKGKGSSRV